MTYSIVKIREGCWEARVYLGSYLSGGRRVPLRRKKRFKTRSSAREWAIEVMGGRKGTSTLAERFPAFLEHLECRRATYDTYACIIGKHLAPAFGHLAPEKVTEAELLRFRKDRPHLARSTLRSYENVLCAVLRWCGVVPPRLKRLERRPHVTLTLAEQQQLLQAVSGEQQRAVALALFGGLRAGEVLALTWRDVQGDRVTVAKSLYRGKVTGTKTHRTRTVTMPATAMQYLSERGADSEQVVGLCATTLRKGYVETCERLGLPTHRFHDLRHTHAAMLFHLNPRILQERLGHADVRTTLSVYTEVLPSMEALAARELDTIWTLVGHHSASDGDDERLQRASPGRRSSDSE